MLNLSDIINIMPIEEPSHLVKPEAQIGAENDFKKNMNEGLVSLYVGNVPKDMNVTACLVTILAPFVHRFHRCVYRNGHAFLDCTIKRECTVEQLTTTCNGANVQNFDGTVSVLQISTANSPARGISTYIDDRRIVFLYPIECKTPREDIKQFIREQCNINVRSVERFDSCLSARITLNTDEEAFRLIGKLNGATFKRHQLVVTHMEPSWVPKHHASRLNEHTRLRVRECDSPDVPVPKRQKEGAEIACGDVASFHLFGFRTPSYPYVNDIVKLFKPFVTDFLKLRHRQYGYGFLDVNLKGGISPANVIQNLNSAHMGPEKSQILKVNVASKPSGSLLAEITQKSDTLFVYLTLPAEGNLLSLLQNNGYKGSLPEIKTIKAFGVAALIFKSTQDASDAHDAFRSLDNTEFVVSWMEPGGHVKLLQNEMSHAPDNDRVQKSEVELHYAEDVRKREKNDDKSVISIRFEDLNKKNYSYTADIVRLLQPYTEEFLKARKSESSMTIEVILRRGIAPDLIKAALRSMPLNEFQGSVRISLEEGCVSSKHQDNESVVYIYPIYGGVSVSDLNDFLSSNKCFPQHAAIDTHSHCVVLVMRSAEEADYAIRDLNGKFWSTMRCPVVCTHMHP